MKVPKKCSREGCPKVALYYPRARVWTVGRERGTHPPLSIIPDLPSCRLCAIASDWYDPETLADRMAQATVDTGQDFPPPDWYGAVFDAVSIRTGKHPHSREVEEEVE